MNRLVYLPIIWAIVVSVGLMTTFVLTIEYGHFNTYVLYISRTGYFEPEKSIFFAVLAVSAVLDAVIKYYMYKHLHLHSGNRHPRVQISILAIGLISCVGTLLVGAYPANVYPLTHWIGTILSFAGATIHNVWLATLQYKLNISSQFMLHIRMLNASITIIFAGIFFLFLNRSFWAPEWERILFDIDVLSEWIAASTLLINNLSYCVDLNSLPSTSQPSSTLYWSIECSSTGVSYQMYGPNQSSHHDNAHSWYREEMPPNWDQSSHHDNAHSWQREEMPPNWDQSSHHDNAHSWYREEMPPNWNQSSHHENVYSWHREEMPPNWNQSSHHENVYSWHREEIYIQTAGLDTNCGQIRYSFAERIMPPVG